MIKPNEYYAYFTVVGEFDPETISARLGLMPTDFWKKGDRSEQTHLERTFSRWSLYSRLDRSAPMEKQVDDVLEQLQPSSQAVVELSADAKVYMQLVGYFHRDYPGLSFEASTLFGLSGLRLGMDMDFYYMYSDKREDS